MLQYFSTVFSEMLAHMERHVSLWMPGMQSFFGSSLRKRPETGLARINHGWGQFVRSYGLEEGNVLIFCLLDVGDSVLMRLFRVVDA